VSMCVCVCVCVCVRACVLGEEYKVQLKKFPKPTRLWSE
jgi:hypothetical protein